MTEDFRTRLVAGEYMELPLTRGKRNKTFIKGFQGFKERADQMKVDDLTFPRYPEIECFYMSGNKPRYIYGTVVGMDIKLWSGTRKNVEESAEVMLEKLKLTQEQS